MSDDRLTLVTPDQARNLEDKLSRAWRAFSAAARASSAVDRAAPRTPEELLRAGVQDIFTHLEEARGALTAGRSIVDKVDDPDDRSWKVSMLEMIDELVREADTADHQAQLAVQAVQDGTEEGLRTKPDRQAFAALARSIDESPNDLARTAVVFSNNMTNTAVESARDVSDDAGTSDRQLRAVQDADLAMRQARLLLTEAAIQLAREFDDSASRFAEQGNQLRSAASAARDTGRPPAVGSHSPNVAEQAGASTLSTTFETVSRSAARIRDLRDRLAQGLTHLDACREYLDSAAAVPRQLRSVADNELRFVIKKLSSDVKTLTRAARMSDLHAERAQKRFTSALNTLDFGAAREAKGHVERAAGKVIQAVEQSPNVDQLRLLLDAGERQQSQYTDRVRSAGEKAPQAWDVNRPRDSGPAR
jgi:hypothetical protein